MNKEELESKLNTILDTDLRFSDMKKDDLEELYRVLNNPRELILAWLEADSELEKSIRREMAIGKFKKTLKDRTRLGEFFSF